MNPMRKGFYKMEQTVFGVDEPQKFETDELVQVLKELETSNRAFVVFESQASRNKAVHALEDKDGIDYAGARLELVKANCEPESVLWQNFGNNTREKVINMTGGMFRIACGLLLWALLFYAPYAW